MKFFRFLVRNNTRPHNYWQMTHVHFFKRGFSNVSHQQHRWPLLSGIDTKTTAVVGFSTIGIAGASSYFLRDDEAPASKASTISLDSMPKPIHNTSAHNIAAACNQFRQILGPENMSLLRQNLVDHSGSEWQSFPWSPETAMISAIVLYPRSTEDVASIAKICHSRRIPITPMSGGTSIEGHYIPTRGGVCIDFSRMNQILSINTADLDCVVQPGVGWEDLNEELSSRQLFFPPDPGPGAMIGGMVGTGCSGTNAARYGTMKENVLSLTVVLADGTIIKTRRRPRKSSAGYDLTRMFIGSEGTLGLVTEIVCKLAVKPKHESVAVCTFGSIRDAANAVQSIMTDDVQVAAVEILDEVQMRSINEAKLTSRVWSEAPTLFFKFTGNTMEQVLNQAKQVGGITRQFGSTSFQLAATDKECLELWSARKAALWSMLALRKSSTDKIWTTDVAVPLSRLADIIDETKEDIRQTGLLGSIVGHVGDGNFHTLLLFPEEKRDVAEDLVHRMVDRALQMDGTATGEHGIGLVKRDHLEHELGIDTVDAMRKLKTAFDPLCILNCDKVVKIEEGK